MKGDFKKKFPNLSFHSGIKIIIIWAEKNKWSLKLILHPQFSSDLVSRGLMQISKKINLRKLCVKVMSIFRLKIYWQVWTDLVCISWSWWRPWFTFIASYSFRRMPYSNIDELRLGDIAGTILFCLLVLGLLLGVVANSKMLEQGAIANILAGVLDRHRSLSIWWMICWRWVETNRYLKIVGVLVVT